MLGLVACLSTATVFSCWPGKVLADATITTKQLLNAIEDGDEAMRFFAYGYVSSLRDYLYFAPSGSPHCINDFAAQISAGDIVKQYYREYRDATAVQLIPAATTVTASLTKNFPQKCGSQQR